MNIALPLISVIVPVYNVDRHLEKCLTSLACQTYPNIEFILVNDGSTDLSPAICEQYRLRDDRFRVLHQANAGVSAARNSGIKLARGEYIGFVDSDDWVDPKVFEIMMEAATTFHADIAICDAYTYAGGETKVRYNFKKEHGHSQPKMLDKLASRSRILGANAPVWNKLFRKSAILGHYFDTRIKYGEDILFMATCCRTIQNAVFLPQPLYYYNISRQGNVVSGPISSKSADLARVGVTINCLAERGTLPREAAVRRNQIIFMELTRSFVRTPLGRLRSKECRESIAEMQKLAFFLRREATNRKCRILSFLLLFNPAFYHVYAKIDQAHLAARRRFFRSQ